MRWISGAAALAVFAVAMAPGGAEAASRSVTATADDGTTFVVSGGGPLSRLDGRRAADFSLADNPPVDPDATTAVGGDLQTVRLPLARKGSFSVGALLTCGHGGANYVYGTAGRRVARVIAVLADGRRLRLQRFAAPSSWHYRGAIFMTVTTERVGLLGVRGRDARGHLVSQARYAPPRPCRGDGFPKPPGQTFENRRPDPDIVDGTVARHLAAAERTWRRSRIRSYDFQLKLFCFCTGTHWADNSVRNGKPVGTTRDTVVGLFRQIRREIESRPASLSVRYNRYGVPLVISSDQSIGVADDELTVRVRHFRRG